MEGRGIQLLNVHAWSAINRESIVWNGSQRVGKVGVGGWSAIAVIVRAYSEKHVSVFFGAIYWDTTLTVGRDQYCFGSSGDLITSKAGTCVFTILRTFTWHVLGSSDADGGVVLIHKSRLMPGICEQGTLD